MVMTTFSGNPSHKVLFDRPQLKWVAVRGCVDMDCDGIKRFLEINCTEIEMNNT